MERFAADKAKLYISKSGKAYHRRYVGDNLRVGEKVYLCNGDIANVVIVNRCLGDSRVRVTLEGTPIIVWSNTLYRLVSAEPTLTRV